MSISIPSNVLYIGVTNSGKTHSFKYMFKKIANKFKYGVLISSTANLNYDYNFMPKDFIHDEFKEDIITNMIEMQEEKVKFAMEKYGQNNYKNHVDNSFIIIDDSIGMIDFHHSIFNSLFSKSRHLFISVFILIQHLTAISPCMRVNCLYIAITIVSDNNIDTLYKLIPGFDSKKKLKEYLQEKCINYQVMWVDKYNPYETQKIKILKFPEKSCEYKLRFI